MYQNEDKDAVSRIYFFFETFIQNTIMKKITCSYIPFSYWCRLNSMIKAFPTVNKSRNYKMMMIMKINKVIKITSMMMMMMMMIKINQLNLLIRLKVGN